MGKRSSFGFTLVELLITISIMGILAGLISGNFFTSLKKGRDARRKADLQNIQKALEAYYEDEKAYPTSIPSASNPFCETGTCDAGEKIYMQQIPKDPAGYQYYYTIGSDTSTYQLYSCIENDLDQGAGVNQAGYNNNCGSCPCKFGVSSSNATP